jgi:hypothetical protein
MLSPSSITTYFPEFNNKNTLIIYAGPVDQNFGNLSGVAIEDMRAYISENIQSDTRICFDDMYEGTAAISLLQIHEIIRDRFPENRVYFFTSALDIHEIYHTLVEKYNIQNRIHVNTCVTWARALMNRSDLGPDTQYDIREKDKIFLCFNRIARRHRRVLLGLVSDSGLLDKSYYSFLNGLHPGQSVRDISESLERFVGADMSSVVSSGISKITLPLKLNIEADDNVNYIKESDKDYFRNSYLSVVTETFFFKFHLNYKGKYIDDQNSIFFSEKIFKPILMKHPFVLVSRPNSLKKLRELGYKTFSPMIDETYDSIENDVDRMSAIVKEMNRLALQTTAEWISWQECVSDIVNYNHKIFFKGPDRYGVSRGAYV